MISRNLKPEKSSYGVILLAAAGLFSLASVTQAKADAQLATSVMAAAGGEASSASFTVKSTLSQSVPIGLATSTNFRAKAGFWYQDPVAPSAIGHLTATLSVSDIVLEWSPAADNVAIDHYVVYRGTHPDFTPTSGDSIAGTKGISHKDSGVAGIVGTDYFYLVKAADPSHNLAEDSKRVGEFDSQMMNGMR